MNIEGGDMQQLSGRRLRLGVVVCAMTVALGNGCASFRQGTLAPLTGWPPPAPATKKSIAISVTEEAALQGMPGMIEGQEGTSVPISQQVLDLWHQQAVAAYKESGLFSEVRTFGATDLRADVRIEDRGDPGIGLAVLSGLTLTLVPAKATDTFVMRTTFRNADGYAIATIEKSETVSTWLGLFMLFLMPTNSMQGVVVSMITDLNRATIAEAHAKGLL